MRNTIILVCLLMVLTASVASAATWNSTMTADGTTSWIDVLTTATSMGTYWNWTYALTPKNGATNIRGLTITLGAPAAVLVTNTTSVNQVGNVPVGWTGFTSGSAVYWQIQGNGIATLDTGQTFIFGFDHPWGPNQSDRASAMDTYGYGGPVQGPVVPEPMSLILGIMGLSSVAGFRKLRRK